MLRTDNLKAVELIRNFLDEVSFAYVTHRTIPHAESHVFANFRTVQEAVKALNPLYCFLFSVFRQGHVAEDVFVREVLPPDVLEAFVATGLLVQDRRKLWSTPGLAIVPVEGLYLVVSVPPHYPTAKTRKQPIYIGPESLWLTKAIPARLVGRRVLDICSGSGIQGLICAARGAARVVGLEKSPEAVSISRFNVALNRLEDVVEIRHSDLYSALEEDEVYDFVISNPPFMPVMEEVDYPICGSGGVDGTRLLQLIFAGLPKHLAAEAEGVMFCNALGDQYSINFNREVLSPLAKAHQLLIRAYVDEKMLIKDYVPVLQKNLINTCPELTAEQRLSAVAAWEEELARRGVLADYIYGQIIRFWKGRPEAGMENLPTYVPSLTDPLYFRAMCARSVN